MLSPIEYSNNSFIEESIDLKPELKLWYENIKPNTIYPNLESLFYHNINLNSEEAIVFYINSESGFGSQITLLIQFSLYLQKINPKIHCLGHFSENNNNFKYHDTTYNNSFFLYFRYLKYIKEDVNIYFVSLSLTVLRPDQFPFIEPQTIEGSNVDSIPTNKIYSDFFKENYELKIGNNITNRINKIKTETKLPLIGIHIRCMLQLVAHSYGRNLSIINQIERIKNELDIKYTNYNIFFITDVSDYLDEVQNIFKETNVNIYYNNFINRIQSDRDKTNNYNDSVINLSEYTGFKLGSDILYDCLSLVNCDYYYVSITNIAFITSFISKHNNAIHFN